MHFSLFPCLNCRCQTTELAKLGSNLHLRLVYFSYYILILPQNVEVKFQLVAVTRPQRKQIAPGRSHRDQNVRHPHIRQGNRPKCMKDNCLNFTLPQSQRRRTREKTLQNEDNWNWTDDWRRPLAHHRKIRLKRVIRTSFHASKSQRDLTFESREQRDPWATGASRTCFHVRVFT